jgi:hypothetical protein
MKVKTTAKPATIELSKTINEKKVIFCTSQEIHEQMKIHCIKTGVTLKNFITEAIQEKLERE